MANPRSLTQASGGQRKEEEEESTHSDTVFLRPPPRGDLEELPPSGCDGRSPASPDRRSAPEHPTTADTDPELLAIRDTTLSPTYSSA